MIPCPVCGFQFLPESALNHGICPSCGTEFGYDDVAQSYEALRTEWLRSGGEWFDKNAGPPADWDAFRQVMQAFYPVRFTSQPLRQPIKTEFKLDVPSIDPDVGSLRIAG